MKFCFNTVKSWLCFAFGIHKKQEIYFQRSSLIEHILNTWIKIPSLFFNTSKLPWIRSFSMYFVVLYWFGSLLWETTNKTSCFIISSTNPSGIITEIAKVLPISVSSFFYFHYLMFLFKILAVWLKQNWFVSSGTEVLLSVNCPRFL